jgi:hypothetical protein
MPSVSSTTRKEMTLVDGSESRDTKAKSVADSLWRRGVRAEHFDTMHSSVREHYARAHGIDPKDEEMWGSVANYMKQM